MTRLLLCLLLSGCGHLATDLRAHEEGHCREWGVAPKHWTYTYRTDEDLNDYCYKATGRLWAAACAQHVGPFCNIALPQSMETP